MGIFGGFEVVKRGAEKVRRVAKTVKSKVSNVCAKVTGKAKFDEAKRIHDKAVENYERHKEKFESKLNIYISDIDKHVKSINDSKRKIRLELFPTMAEKAKRFHKYGVGDGFAFEKYTQEKIEFSTIRSKHELGLDYFDEHKFRRNALAILTWGFATRKKAKEAVFKAKEEKEKLEYEMKKMDIELDRVKLIEQSLSNVAHYFTELVALYEKLLTRADNSINLLSFHSMLFIGKVQEKFSGRMLPFVQIKELLALDQISQILSKMVDTKIISLDFALEESSNTSNYDDELNKYRKKVKAYNKKVDTYKKEMEFSNDRIMELDKAI